MSIEEGEELVEALVEQTSLDMWSGSSDRLAQTKNFLMRIFRCWHPELSLPFTRDGETYRTCVTCGARRRFDLNKWTTVGDFYYPERKIQ